MHYDSISFTCSVLCPASQHLLDPVQPRPVHGNLVINLVRLACNPLDVFVLCVHLLTHCLTKLVQALSSTTERIYRNTH
jgi:hypothetical protein